MPGTQWRARELGAFSRYPQVKAVLIFALRLHFAGITDRDLDHVLIMQHACVLAYLRLAP
jgi:hypothetical protein